MLTSLSLKYDTPHQAFPHLKCDEQHLSTWPLEDSWLSVHGTDRAYNIWHVYATPEKLYLKSKRSSGVKSRKVLVQVTSSLESLASRSRYRWEFPLHAAAFGRTCFKETGAGVRRLELCSSAPGLHTFEPNSQEARFQKGLSSSGTLNCVHHRIALQVPPSQNKPASNRSDTSTFQSSVPQNSVIPILVPFPPHHRCPFADIPRHSWKLIFSSFLSRKQIILGVQEH